MVALIADAALLISNNSGPVHMAAALGTPVVVLYALTNPQHTPWQVRQRVLYHDVPCKYCYRSVCPQGHHACLSAVTPGEVIAAAEALLATGQPLDRPSLPTTLPPIVPERKPSAAAPPPRFFMH
jgi:ADP-heptose:LPS heptosyltransferase